MKRKLAGLVPAGLALALVAAPLGAFAAEPKFHSPFPSYTLPSGGIDELAFEDLNNDGHQDALLLDYVNNRIAIFKGNGDGTYPAPVYYPVGTFPFDVVVSDFDEDGDPDLAVSNDGSGSISILLNNGDRTVAASVYGGLNAPTQLVSGDFNGDGNADLATAENGNDAVTVLLGTGGGAFAPPVSYTAGPYPIDIAMGDYDGDGRLDLASTNQWSSISIFSGNGDDTFQSKFDLPIEGFVASGDWNEDGLADLAFARNAKLTLLTSRAEGELAFSAPTFSASEKDANAIVSVNRTGSAYGQTKVRIQTSDITAVAGTDYDAVDEMIVFGPGETTKNVTVPVKDNSTHGTDRTFGVTISGPTNEATLGTLTSAVVTIQEDDPAPDTSAPVLDLTKFAAVDNYSGTPDRLAGAVAAVDEAGATVRAYRWIDADADSVVDAEELGSAIALGTSGADGSVPGADIGDLGPGTYPFVVTAEDAAANESPRTAAAVTVTLTKDLAPDVAVPTWPADAALTVSSVTYESLRLEWPAAVDDRGVDRHELTKDGGAPVVLSAATLSRDIEGLSASTAYEFSVVAVDPAGNRSIGLVASPTTLPQPEREQPQQQQPIASGEARLQQLTLAADAGPVSLTPAFDRNVFAYEAKTTALRITLNAEPTIRRLAGERDKRRRQAPALDRARSGQKRHPDRRGSGQRKRTDLQPDDQSPGEASGRLLLR
ncbi:FG-GAP-like repeat-containing protein [Paenibacillus sp. 1P07SE]|uniref:FG-GAP-like repeat-containing protein n=1 Tax=Paenibacillus sp. 1P07SE TaxID=3132209 RepID=UPI0039A45444